MRRLCLFPVLSLLAVGCSSESDEGTGNNPDPIDQPDGGGPSTSCPDGPCVDPIGSYEPAERVDFDNIVSYSDSPPTLDLPEPPKSGFRLVVPPRELGPGEEVASTCHAWEFPTLTHRNVYAARLYTNGMLHHSNMFGVPLAAAGPSPYPDCIDGQADIFAQVNNFLAGNIMDVLFANSTQIQGGEAVVFPPGMAFKLTLDGREASTTIHWINTTGDTFTSESVYDFYTMPDGDVEHELVPFVFENQGFSVPAQTTGDIVTTCDIVTPGSIASGTIVSIMPHTHKRATDFVVDLLDASGAAERIYTSGGYDLESDIEVFDTPISLAPYTQIRHTCTVQNDLTEPIVWGLGEMEMCTLFGYMYPPQSQRAGYVARGSVDCGAFDLGSLRP